MGQLHVIFLQWRKVCLFQYTLYMKYKIRYGICDIILSIQYGFNTSLAKGTVA